MQSSKMKTGLSSAINYSKLENIEDGLPNGMSKEKDTGGGGIVVDQIKGDTKHLLKYASLLTLTVQNAALALTMRMARTQKDLFISSTAVIMSEVMKLLTCFFMVSYDEGGAGNMLKTVNNQIIREPLDTLKVAIPSIVYYIQNNLIYLGATHLDAATTQVTYQLKILTTAVFSVVMLRKRLVFGQWVALFLLFIGVALVQLVQIGRAPAKTSHEQNPLIGFFAILTACVLSGFAGVYFEKILKGTARVSLWIRNIQLSAIAIPFGLIQVFMTDWDSIQTQGFFFGYTFITWVVVVLQAQGGLLVAVVVKYADNILKGFATSLAIILACIASIYFFDFQLTPQFALGASLVIASIFLYSKPPGNTKSVQSAHHKS